LVEEHVAAVGFDRDVGEQRGDGVEGDITAVADQQPGQALGGVNGLRADGMNDAEQLHDVGVDKQGLQAAGGIVANLVEGDDITENAQVDIGRAGQQGVVGVGGDVGAAAGAGTGVNGGIAA